MRSKSRLVAAMMRRLGADGGAAPPHPGELAVLQKPEQLGLQRRRQIPHLVEEDRPLAGQFHAARLGLGRAGERPFFMAE